MGYRAGLLLVLLTGRVFADILLGQSMNHTIRHPRIVRAAVANSKIVGLRTIGADELLLTGKRAGATMVRVWHGAGVETAYTVRVLEPTNARSLNQVPSEGVIKISMEFMEIDLVSAREMGIQWPTSLELSGTLQLAGSASAAGNTSGLNYSVNGLTAKTMINFLMREGFARTLANPELFVRTGETASFHSGGEIPIPTGHQNLGGFYKKVEWKPFGLSIQVRPSSEDGYRIHSDVKIDISEITQENALDGIPGMNRKKIETKMDAVDGATVVLSALLKQRSSEKKEGTPFLSSIPLLGNLFSSTVRVADEKQLIAAMTFSISNPARETTRLDRFRSKFHD
ncbi:MAG: pilus assembly protein N-terminal domain-containing protein [Deltaproteobacteria bacterium]|nr:pilus assembly protein N-terminal domain-containing protein [Deltaproteobacteria bacterium]MBI3295539.1 pilus assembly protein N-terminal domain-containing protein [Deltaproteobacteria bacterium]